MKLINVLDCIRQVLLGVALALVLASLILVPQHRLLADEDPGGTFVGCNSGACSVTCVPFIGGCSARICSTVGACFRCTGCAAIGFTTICECQ